MLCIEAKSPSNAMLLYKRIHVRAMVLIWSAIQCGTLIDHDCATRHVGGWKLKTTYQNEFLLTVPLLISKLVLILLKSTGQIETLLVYSECPTLQLKIMKCGRHVYGVLVVTR